MKTTVSENFELNDLELIGSSRAGFTLVQCGSWCASKDACSAYSFSKTAGPLGVCKIGTDPAAKRPMQGARVYYRYKGEIRSDSTIFNTELQTKFLLV